MLTLDELIVYIGASPAVGKERMWSDSAGVAAGWAEKHTGRQFRRSTGARYFDPTGDLVHIDDCTTITSVEVDWAGTGTHTPWDGYQPLPAYGHDPDLGAVPYTSLLALHRPWPRVRREGVVKVVGEWGWAAVPDDVKRAVAILTQDLLRDPHSSFGGLNVVDDGVVLGSRVPARTLDLLAPYERVERTVGIA